VELLTGTACEEAVGSPPYEEGIMTTMADPVFLATPPRTPIEPTAPLDRSGITPTLGERTFELESPNGYARTVVGTVEYLDDEARTYMVRSAGALVRVPLRDIKAEHESTRGMRR
jgi:hypothetical protein